MSAFKRYIVEGILEAILRNMPVFQVIIGPRQVGKTTAAKQIIERFPYDSIYASADAPLPAEPDWIDGQWRLAVQKAETTGKPVLLVLDEIQKVPNWSGSLKALWDQRTVDIRLLILGSSALLIHQGLTESLAGRFYLHRFTHWSLPECKKAFGWSLNDWFYFGGYPGGEVFKADDFQWKQYISNALVETVISKDVLQLHPITKPALLHNLFGLAATFPSQIFSYNKMLGQLQEAGNTTTVAHYLRILGQAYLVTGLELFSLGQIRKRGSSPKLILWNNALINGLSLKSYEQTLADPVWWGRVVENAVGAYLLNAFAGKPVSMTYWRKRSAEVDFVLQSGTDVVALEIKSGRQGKVSGLQAFKNEYKKSRTMIIGGNGIPLEEFLSIPPEQLIFG
ncbi:ATP-binding protein [Pontiellaceae bacterium B12227]|nr:ATP-binding protein [Pontiellaceae bacterium B12227]